MQEYLVHHSKILSFSEGNRGDYVFLHGVEDQSKDTNNTNNKIKYSD